MKVWAHRGYSFLYPENTMLAFQKALEAGADGIEMDIHLSSDKRIVVIHDESLLRTCGIERNVEDCSFKELTSTKASRTMDDRFDVTIPSFEEFCDFIASSPIMANVEIKTGVTYYPGIERIAAEMVRSFGIEDKVIFSSFNPLSLTLMKKELPDCRAGLLFMKGIDPRHISYIARENGLDYLHPDFSLLDDEMIEEAKTNQLGINAWTVNEETEMEKLIKWNISGVITNKPEMCLSLLGR